MMRVALGLTRPVELEIEAFSFYLDLATVAILYSSFHKTLNLCPILGMSALRAAALAFTRLAGWSIGSVGATLSSRDSVRDV